MAWADPRDANARKYIVAPWLGGWRVTLDDAKEADFAELGPAIAHACGLARERAYAGVPAIVVVEASVKELHSFTPSPATHSAPHLRLVASRGS